MREALEDPDQPDLRREFIPVVIMCIISTVTWSAGVSIDLEFQIMSPAS